MKISTKVRADAIRVCEAAANTGTEDDCRATLGFRFPYYSDVARALGVSASAEKLARAAWAAAFGFEGEWTREVDAEAACLLRDGWCPGDGVVRRV